MLIEQGKLTDADADAVLQQQAATGMRFGEAARSLGLVDEADIHRVLALQFKHSIVESEIDQYPPELIAAHAPSCVEIDTLRAVRSQLMLRQFKLDRKVVGLINMNETPEGSFFAANLAIVFSQAGERTLLIDANLMNGRQEKIFNIKSGQGLSDILAGRAGMEKIAKIRSFPNLSVLAGGTVAPNPHELLWRQSFATFNEAVSSCFDMVLYDVSAAVAETDALAIAAHAGNVVVLASRHATRMLRLNSIADRIQRSGADIIGTVLIDA